MITKTQIRNETRKAVDLSDPTKKITKNWEMTNFRHALFKIAEECKNIQACHYKVNIENKLSICDLFFKTKTLICSYKYKTKTVSVTEVDDKNQVKSSATMPVEALPNYVKSLQPKVKIILKRK